MDSKRNNCTKVVLFIAICLFAISSWIDINGLFVELPLLVQVLPEGWNLPSYLVIIIQIANVGPLTYVLLKKFKPGLVKEWIGSCVIISIGIIACFILIFTWDKTSYIAGGMHSTALLSLSLFLATVDCTSSVVYLPYMAKFKSPIFMTALYVGEGLSGLIPALVGLAQGFGVQLDESIVNGTFSNATSTSQPVVRFSVSVFMAILTILLALSLASFLFINFHPMFDAFKVDCDKKDTSADQDAYHTETTSGDLGVDNHSFEVGPGSIKTIQSVSSSETSVAFQQQIIEDGISSELISEEHISEKKLSKRDLYRCIAFYILVAWINALNNGIIPSIQSYSCLPYGNLTYDLAVKLSVFINPLACFLTLVVTTKRLSVISILGSVGTFLTAYHVYLAALSPNPVLKDDVAGIVLAVSWLIFISSTLYKLCLRIDRYFKYYSTII